MRSTRWISRIQSKPSAWVTPTTKSNNDEVEQLSPGDVRVAVEILATGLPHPWQRVTDRRFVRIAAQYEGAAEVRLPLLEDGPEWFVRHDNYWIQ